MIRSYEDTIVRANNMSAEQIIDNFNLTEEGIRHYSLAFVLVMMQPKNILMNLI